MVFMPKGDRDLIILDGQQRVATTVIALSSIRTWLKEHGHDRDADKIQHEYIGIRELGEEELEARLMLNENNNHVFYERVVHEAPARDIEALVEGMKRYDPSRRLAEAILFCRQRIEELARSTGSDPQAGAKALFGFVKYLRDNVKIVRLSVPSESNAYTVFETLNARGLDLSVLDLVKNYLFGKASGDRNLQEVKIRWGQMMSNLANVPADDFLKAYWTSRHGRTQKASLFPDFKARVRNARDVTARMTDMLDASEQYAALEIADDPLWADYSKEARDRVRALKLLGARQVHPVLLAALARFGKREVERLLHLLEVLIVRYQLIGGGRTGRLEISCAALAAAIYSRQVTAATVAFRALRDIYPSDTEFQAAFQIKQETNNRKAHYVLERLEQQARLRAASSRGPLEMEPSANLTVEHVLPRNPGPGWNAVLQKDPNIAEECTYRLGNLCLLTTVNSKLGQESFDAKKTVYSASTLVLTKLVASESQWSRQAIEKLQGKMAKLAVAAWRFQ